MFLGKYQSLGTDRNSVSSEEYNIEYTAWIQQPENQLFWISLLYSNYPFLWFLPIVPMYLIKLYFQYTTVHRDGSSI